MIGVALIGAGSIAATHLEAFRRFPDRCRVITLCDIYPEKAEALVRSHSMRAEVVQDARKAIANPAVDLVSICLPPSAHAEVAIAALEARKHVLVEKPMAASLAECDAMIEAARASNRLLSVVAQNRYRTATMKVRRLLEEGWAGRVLHAQVDSFWWRGRAYYDLWWRGTWAREGGGCTLNHAVHHIDLLHWMRGMPAEVLAVIANTAHDNSEVEDLSVAILRHPDGTLSQVTASLVHHGEEQRLVFQGERAGLWIPWRVAAARSLENGFPTEDTQTARAIQARYDELPALEHEGHAGQIDNVLAAIEGRAPLLLDGVEGRKTLELVTAIYASSARGETVKLPLEPSDPFYRAEGLREAMPRFNQKRSSAADAPPPASAALRGPDVVR